MYIFMLAKDIPDSQYEYIQKHLEPSITRSAYFIVCRLPDANNKPIVHITCPSQYSESSRGSILSKMRAEPYTSKELLTKYLTTFAISKEAADTLITKLWT